MSEPSIGVAMIGAGMAGRPHAHGYRTVPTVFDQDLPDVRLDAIADAHEPFAVDTAKRYGYERADTSWEAVVAAPDIDAFSVVVANATDIAGLPRPGPPVRCQRHSNGFPERGSRQNDFFTYQAHAFLDQVAGRAHLPPCPSLADGLHNIQVLAAVVATAGAADTAVTVR